MKEHEHRILYTVLFNVDELYKRKKIQRQKVSMAANTQGQRKGWTDLGHKKNLPYLIVVIDILLCTFVKIHQNIHLDNSC